MGPSSLIARARRALAGGALLAVAVIGFALPRVASAQKKTSAIAVRGTVTGADIVRAARDYLGVRYVWGGDTPRAFDCSGFTRYVFARYGIALPRTAHEQAAFGDAPFPGDLRAGDLLFFSGGQGAQHIAIYVGGDTIIHASSSAKRGVCRVEVAKTELPRPPRPPRATMNSWPTTVRSAIGASRPSS